MLGVILSIIIINKPSLLLLGSAEGFHTGRFSTLTINH